jgi:hypothetical protein
MKSFGSTATFLLLHFIGTTDALKPFFQEIYQSGIASTTTFGDIYVCDEGKVLEGSNCYWLFDEPCYNIDAEFAIPKNDVENNFLVSLAAPDPFYLGIVGLSGVWQDFNTLSPATYLNFAEEPDVIEGCAYAVSPATTWLLNRCDEPMWFICVEPATVSGTTVVAQSPAAVNGATGGSLAVPVSGELILYRQFIDPSTGVESAFQYPTLTFVEADEAIHRASLVSVLSISWFSIFLIPPSSIRLLCKEVLSPVSLLPPIPPLLKAKFIISKASTALGRCNKS